MERCKPDQARPEFSFPLALREGGITTPFISNLGDTDLGAF